MEKHTMKKFILLGSLLSFITACSPVDSVRTLDQQQAARLVRNMYPAEVAAATKNK